MIVVFYLIAQMVGAGKLIQLLFGLPYARRSASSALLMMLYVTFGGMLATTWVQIIKAVLLLSGAALMSLVHPVALRLQPGGAVPARRCAAPEGMPAIMAPGGSGHGPVSAMSLGVALIFGTAGLPHILMRFFTVRDAREARTSVLVATGFISVFYTLLFVLGFGAIALVSTDRASREAGGGLIGGANMVALHLADAIGGSLLLGFISAVAFATILAVVSGLDARRRGRGQPRPLRPGDPPRAGERGRGGARVQDRRPSRSACSRWALGVAVREPEHRLHGRAGLRGRGKRQLSRILLSRWPGPA